MRCLLKVILKQDNKSRNIPSYSKAYKAWKRSVVTTTIDVRVTKVSVNVNDRTDKVLEVWVGKIPSSCFTVNQLVFAASAQAGLRRP